MVIKKFGYKEIKCGATLNLYIMSNGVFADITFGKKIYISYDSINDVEVNGSKLIIFVNEDDKDKQIVFKVQNMRAIDKMFNTIRQNEELEYRGIEDTNINSQPLESKSTTYVNIENEQIEPKSTQRDRVKELKNCTLSKELKEQIASNNFIDGEVKILAQKKLNVQNFELSYNLIDYTNFDKMVSDAISGKSENQCKRDYPELFKENYIKFNIEVK